jgi:hypothetical protein
MKYTVRLLFAVRFGCLERWKGKMDAVKMVKPFFNSRRMVFGYIARRQCDFKINSSLKRCDCQGLWLLFARDLQLLLTCFVVFYLKNYNL